MNIDVVDIAELNAGIQRLLADAPTVGQDGVAVERSAPEPKDIPANGWVGIYKSLQLFPVIIAGAGQAGRNHEIETIIACSAIDETSGEECEDRLGALVKNVLDVLLNDGSFAGKVDFIRDVRVQYARYENDDVRFTQAAYIFLTGVKRI